MNKMSLPPRFPRCFSGRLVFSLMTMTFLLLSAAATAQPRERLKNIMPVAPKKPEVVEKAPKKEEERQFKNFAVSESRHVEELFENAQLMISKRDWVGGVSHIQEIMDRYANKVHLVDERQIVYRSYRERCLDQLRLLPESGLAAYRQQYDKKAAKLLEQGRQSRNPDVLKELVRRFSLTSSADQAMKSLGEIYLEKGDVLEALYYFHRILFEHQGSTSDSAETLLNAAYCCFVAGKLDRLLEISERARDVAPSAGKVNFRGSTVDLSQQINRWIEVTSEEDINKEDYSWTMMGGDPGRNRALTVPKTDSPLQWTFPLPQIDYGRNQQRSYQNYRDVTHHSDTVYPVHPVVGPDSVIIHNGYEVQSLDLYVGRLKWTFTSPDEDDLAERTDTRQIFSGVLAEGVYYVNLESAPEESSWDWMHGPVLVPIPMRKLYALNAETGTEIWSHRNYEGETMEEQRFMQKLSISSPPLVTRNTVYAIGSMFEGKIHSYACAFNAKDGRLLWRTLICTGQQELNMFGRPLLEHVASTIAEDQGSLYFSTNLGLIAAVDARLGTIRWITEYDSIDMPLNQGFHFMVRKFVFHNCPPFVTKKSLVIAPLDSESVYCLDTSSGKVNWFKNSRDTRGGFNTVLGEKDGLVLLGGSSVTAVDLETGSIEWGYPLGPRNKAAGLGGVASGMALCPTKENVAALALASGRNIGDSMGLKDLGAGNLIITDRFMIQAGARSMSVCYRWSEVFQALQDRISARPHDPYVFLEVGNIYRQGKEYTEASKNYKKARELAKQDPPAPEIIRRATAGLYSSYKSMGDLSWKDRRLRDAVRWYELAAVEAYDDSTRLESHLDFVRYYRVSGDSKKLIAAYERIITDLPRFQYVFGTDTEPLPAGLFSLLSLAEHFLTIGQPEKSVSTLQRIIEKYPDETYRDGSAHAFARDKITELIQQHGTQVYEPFERLAQTIFDRAQATSDAISLRSIVQEYPNSSVVQRALVRLADLLLEKLEFHEAVSVLRRFLISFPNSELSALVLQKLGESYQKLDHPASARSATRRLNYDRIDTSSSDQSLSNLSVPPASLWRKSYSRSIGLHLIRVTDRSLTPKSDRFFFQSNRVLSCADTATGDVQWSNDLEDRLTPQATLIDELLYVTSSRAVFALSKTDGKVAWKASPQGMIRDSKIIPGTVLLVIENRDQSGIFSLQALEALTGRLLWERNFKGRVYGQLILTESFVSAYSTKPVTMISIDPFDNRKQFEYEVGPHYMHPTELDENRIFIYKQNQLRVLDLMKKEISWEKTVGTAQSKTSVKGSIGFGKRVAVLTAEKNRDFRLAMHNAATGKTEWDTELPSGYILPARPLAHAKGDLILLNRRNDDLNYCLLAVSNRDGSIAWETPPYEGRNLPRQVLETRDHVVVERNYLDDTELKNVILVYNKRTGEVDWDWEHRGNYTSEIALVGDILLIALANQVEAYGR